MKHHIPNIVGGTQGVVTQAQYTKGTGLVWSGPTYGSPANITGATIGGSAFYRTTAKDIRLTQENVTGQPGYMTFHLPDFDFSQDFRVKVGYYILTPTDPSNLGDGFCIALGANNLSNIDYPYNLYNNGGFKTGIRDYFGGGQSGPFIAENQTLTLGDNTNSTQFTNSWREFIFEVRTNLMTGQKIAQILLRGSDIPNLDMVRLGKVTTFTPTGKYVTIGANTGAATGGHYIDSVIIENI